MQSDVGRGTWAIRLPERPLNNKVYDLSEPRLRDGVRGQPTEPTRLGRGHVLPRGNSEITRRNARRELAEEGPRPGPGRIPLHRHGGIRGQVEECGAGNRALHLRGTAVPRPAGGGVALPGWILRKRDGIRRREQRLPHPDRSRRRWLAAAQAQWEHKRGRIALRFLANASLQYALGFGFAPGQGGEVIAPRAVAFPGVTPQPQAHVEQREREHENPERSHEEKQVGRAPGSGRENHEHHHG